MWQIFIKHRSGGLVLSDTVSGLPWGVIVLWSRLHCDAITDSKSRNGRKCKCLDACLHPQMRLRAELKISHSKSCLCYCWVSIKKNLFVSEFTVFKHFNWKHDWNFPAKEGNWFVCWHSAMSTVSYKETAFQQKMFVIAVYLIWQSRRNCNKGTVTVRAGAQSSLLSYVVRSYLPHR